MNYKNTTRHNAYLQTLKQIADEAKLPPDVISETNGQGLNSLLSLVMQDPIERPYTPLVKQMTTTGRIPLGIGATAPEKYFLKQIVDICHDTYGEPIFNYYTATPDQYEAVDAGINTLRFSPYITEGQTTRRGENLQTYLDKEKKNTFDVKLFDQVLDYVFSTYIKLDNLKVDTDVKPMTSAGQKHSSGVGFPGYRNERSTIDGSTYREHAVKGVVEKVSKHGTTGLAALPSVIVGRNQPGGNNIDISKITNLSDYHKQIEKLDYKPGKSRVIGSVPRVLNAYLIPMLAAIIDRTSLDDNPYFSGFWDKDRRRTYMMTFQNTVTKLGLDSANIDFSAFDTSISADILARVSERLKGAFSFTDEQSNIFDSGIANMIFTPYHAMDPRNRKTIVYGRTSHSIPSGHAFTGIVGLLVNYVVMTYAKVTLYGWDTVKSIDAKFSEKNTFAIVGLGDDHLGGLKSIEDLTKIAQIVADNFSMEISTEGLKTARGTFFLQQRLVDGSLRYPISRVLSTSLFTEGKKGLTWTQGDLSFASKLANADENVDRQLQLATALLIGSDKSKLGLRDPVSKKSLTPQEFMTVVRQHSIEENRTPKDSTWDGDPSKEARYDASGQPVDGFIKGYFDLLLASEKVFMESDKVSPPYATVISGHGATKKELNRSDETENLSKD